MLVKISEIKVKPRRWAVQPEDVKELAESMENTGLVNAITLDSQKTLIAGLHRLEAAKLLGWTEIECSILTLEGLQAELAGIDENLIRRKLPPLEEAEAQSRRKRIYETLHPETKRGKRNGQTSKNDRMSFLEPVKTYAQDAAEKQGVTRRTIERQVETAENLTPKAKEILRKSGLNIGKMDALKLSKLPPEQQAEAAHRYASGKIHSISEYKPGDKRQENPVPVIPQRPVLVEPETADAWKPYEIPSAPKESLSSAEIIAGLKSHEKENNTPPWMFLEAMRQFTDQFCRNMAGYLDEMYAPVFPDLDSDQMLYLRQRMDRIITAANNFYDYVKGANENEP